MQVGPNSGHSLYISIGAVTAARLGLRNGDRFAINVERPSGTNITGLLNFLDQVLNVIGRERAHIGVQKNRLYHIYNSLEVQHLNVSESHSRIIDADMYFEHMRFVSASIRQQAGITVLAQSRQMQLTQSLSLIDNMM